MVTTVRQYTVTYERDEDGWWVATVQGVPGVHTQGRTIGDARHRVREALALAIGDQPAKTAELRDDVRLPPDVQKKVLASKAAKERVRIETEKARKLCAEAVRLLTKTLQLSVRDVRNLLGLSHQRVHQIRRRGAVR